MKEATVHLDEIYSSVTSSGFGWIGFRAGQTEKTNPLKIWFAKHPNNTLSHEALEKIFKRVFNEVVWENGDAEITIQLKETLRNPQRLLDSYSEQIHSAACDYVEDQSISDQLDGDYICPCGHNEDEHYGGGSHCLKCGCPQFGEPEENWMQYTEVNLGDSPGGFKTYE